MPPVPQHARHQWHMRFDSIACRNCGVTGDDRKLCRGARRIRAMAGMRLEQPPRREEEEDRRKDILAGVVTTVDVYPIKLWPGTGDVFEAAERDLH